MLFTDSNYMKYRYYRGQNIKELENEKHLTTLLKSPPEDTLELGCINSVKIPFTQVPLQLNSCSINLRTYLILEEDLWSEPDHTVYNTTFSIYIGLSARRIKPLHSLNHRSKPTDINTRAYFSYLEWVVCNIYKLNSIVYNGLYVEKGFTSSPPNFSCIIDEFKFLLNIYKTPLFNGGYQPAVSLVCKNYNYDQVLNINNCLLFFSINIDPIGKRLVSKVF